MPKEALTLRLNFHKTAVTALAEGGQIYGVIPFPVPEGQTPIFIQLGDYTWQPADEIIEKIVQEFIVYQKAWEAMPGMEMSFNNLKSEHSPYRTPE